MCGTRASNEYLKDIAREQSTMWIIQVHNIDSSLQRHDERHDALVTLLNIYGTFFVQYFSFTCVFTKYKIQNLIIVSS